MDWTIYSAYHHGRLGVVIFNGQVYDLSGWIKFRILDDLIAAGRVERSIGLVPNRYTFFRLNPDGSINTYDRSWVVEGNQAVVDCQALCEPFRLEGHPVLNNPQVRSYPFRELKRGSLTYRGQCFDLDQPEDVVQLGKMMEADGLIEVAWSKPEQVSKCKVLEPRFEPLNRLFGLELLTLVFNLKPWFK